ncbi:hypothetical protein ACQKPE_23495 [Pseudomonas sp. NPDC089554]|uniref:hypothetical protein n=1 Tax=Pseudomonas sp. NPDC089554 TaxID=3390653 RepID=UPI003CFCDCEA
MTDTPESSGWADGISFLAQLYLLKDEQPFSLKLGREITAPYEESKVLLPTVLMTAVNGAADLLLFRFSGRSTNRLHYKLSCYGRNAYLNLLNDGSVQSTGREGSALMLEPLEWGKDSLRFKMQDSTGRLIRSMPIPPIRRNRGRDIDLIGDQLSVATGDVAQFLLKRC